MHDLRGVGSSHPRQERRRTLLCHLVFTVKVKGEKVLGIYLGAKLQNSVNIRGNGSCGHQNPLSNSRWLHYQPLHHFPS